MSLLNSVSCDVFVLFIVSCDLNFENICLLNGNNVS